MFRQCWFLLFILCIGFWNCSDSVGFCFPFYLLAFGTVPTVLVFAFHFMYWLLELFRQCWFLLSILFIGFRNCSDSVSFCFPFYLLAFGTVPTVVVFIFHFIYWLLELFRQCWFLFSILFIGFWNCSDSVSFCFPFYLLVFGTVPTVLVFVFHFIYWLLELFRQCWFLFSILFIGFWNCSDSCGFCFPFYLLAFGTVPTVLVFVFHFIYWFLELFRQCWFMFSILFIGFWNCSDSVGFCFPFYLLAFGTVPTVLVFVFHFIYWLLELFRQCWFLFSILFIGFWNCSDSCGFCFPFYLLAFGTVPTVLVFVFHFIYWNCSDSLELFRQCWFLFSILFIFGNVPTVFILAFGTFIYCSDSVGFCFPFLFYWTVFWNCSDSCGFCFHFIYFNCHFIIGFWNCWNCSDSVGFCFPFYLLAFGTVPTVLVFVFHFIYWLLELFRQCWFLFSILFIGFWNCSDSVGFCFPFYLLAFGTVPTVLVFVFHFIYWFLELFRQCWFLFSILFIGFWNCSDSVGFCFPFYLLAFGTVPTVLVFIFHFIYWLLELFRQCWFLFSILFIGFWNCSDSCGFCFPFYLLAFGTVPTVLVFVFHFIYWFLELFRQCWFLFSILFIGFWKCSDSVGFCFHFIYWLLELFRQCWFLFSILFIGFWNCSDSVGFCFPFYLLAFGTVPTVLVFVFHFIYWFLELFRQCWFLFSILFIGFWNCSDSVSFCFPFYLLVFGTVPTVLVFVFHFIYWLLELFRQCWFLLFILFICFSFYVLAFGTVPTVLVFVFHFIYWLLELFRQCWFLFSILFIGFCFLLELFRQLWFLFSILFIGFWNCSDSVGFYFPFFLLAFGTVPTVLVFVFHFIYWFLELFRQCWFLFSILFIGFWNCSDSCGFCFPFYLLAFGTVPTVVVFVFHFIYWLLELFRQCWFLFSILFIGFWNCFDSVGFCFPFYLLAFGTVPTVLVFVFHFIYWLSELFRQCWFLFSILFIGFWNCSDSVGFCFPFYLLAFGTVPTMLVFVFHFIYWLLELFRQLWFLFSILYIGFWNCSDSVGFCFPFYLLAFGTVPTVLVFVFHFIYWLLELFRQCWFLFSILFIGFWNCSDSVGFCFLFYLLAFGTVPTVLVFVFQLFIGFWNCSDSCGFCFPFYLLAFGTVPTVLVFVFHFIYWFLELFRQCWFLFSILFIGFWKCSDSVGFCFPFYLLAFGTVPTVVVFVFHFIYWLLELFRQC